MHRLALAVALLFVAGCAELPPSPIVCRSDESPVKEVADDRQAPGPDEAAVPRATEDGASIEDPIVIEIKGSKDAAYVARDKLRARLEREDEAARRARIAELQASASVSERRHAAWRPAAVHERRNAEPPAGGRENRAPEEPPTAVQTILEQQRAAREERTAEQEAAEAQRLAELQRWVNLRAAIVQGNPSNENGIHQCDMMIERLSR